MTSTWFVSTGASYRSPSDQRSLQWETFVVAALRSFAKFSDFAISNRQRAVEQTSPVKHKQATAPQSNHLKMPFATFSKPAETPAAKLAAYPAAINSSSPPPTGRWKIRSEERHVGKECRSR